MGADCKRFTDWGDVYRLPEIEPAPRFFSDSYPQPTAQPVDSWQRGRAWRRKADPPLLNSVRAVPVLPNKKYLLK